ncbi:MAG: hypothetical protein PHE08_10200 [Bacteroidales bacterium]|nr:hypothetical protein [Bacteroidales bacterium]
MIKHASSHGFSVLICSIIAAFIVKLLEPLAPKLTDGIEGFSIKTVRMLNIPIEGKYFGIVLIAMLLAAIWGVFFKMSQLRK